MVKEGRKKWFGPAALAGCVLFYVCFVLVDGPVVCVDSPSYITMDMSREAGYPLFLAFFRRLFGEEPFLYGHERYLFFCALAASVLNGYAAWRIGALTVRELKKEGRGYAQIAGTAMTLLQLTVALLNRFAAKRGSMYAESIMTESLAMPLFVLFIGHFCLWMRRKEIRHLVCVALLMFLLMMIRSQMIIVPATVVVISFLYDVLGRERRIRRFFTMLFLCAGVLVCSALADRIYNYNLRGVFAGHTLGNKALYSTAMYTATPEDAALFSEDNEDERTLFLTILENCGDGQLNITYAPPDADLITLADHFSWSYDEIGFTATMSDVYDYIDQRVALYNGAASAAYTGHGIDFSDRLVPVGDGSYELPGPVRELVYDDVIGIFNNVLMRRRPPLSPRVFIANIWDGLMNSVARTMAVLQPAVLVIYGCYLFLYLVMRLMKRRGIALAAEIVLGSLLINVVSVSLVMYAQSRYMIYDMGLFYGVFCIMLLEMVWHKHKG